MSEVLAWTLPAAFLVLRGLFVVALGIAIYAVIRGIRQVARGGGTGAGALGGGRSVSGK